MNFWFGANITRFTNPDSFNFELFILISLFSLFHWIKWVSYWKKQQRLLYVINFALMTWGLNLSMPSVRFWYQLAWMKFLTENFHWRWWVLCRNCQSNGALSSKFPDEWGYHYDHCSPRTRQCIVGHDFQFQWTGNLSEGNLQVWKHRT